MLTIKSIMNASADSHLSAIDLMKVTETLLHLTNPKNVLRKQRQFVSFQSFNKKKIIIKLVFIDE